ncbi:thioredoxin fold domain-containing protein [Thermosulfurimonas sp. F29]|uniref:thioredoxin fold domain-containing protein n=1 Tax=Thermosulfurimonas sp. F29 TaxID=2867247 RepID=UPI001C8377D4|nr:thioredoxin fold domain-containing protein [Thermosulfurimonas sp. F29]MBX6423366.1 thioredoxin fold domain-containing protein [Thermosulfurimonas sp. F29]
MKKPLKKTTIGATLGILFTGATLLVPGQPFAAGTCPTKAKVRTILKDLPPEVSIVTVRPVPSLPHWCGVYLRSPMGDLEPLYLHTKHPNVIAEGTFINTDTQLPLDFEIRLALQKLSPADLEKLKSLTAFKIGDPQKPTVYLIVDPDCPFCHALENSLDSAIREGRLHVAVILFPLPIHPQAEDHAVAVAYVARKNPQRAWEMLLERSFDIPETPSQDELDRIRDGLQEIERILSEDLNFQGTPVIVFADGRFWLGGLPVHAVLQAAHNNNKTTRR